MPVKCSAGLLPGQVQHRGERCSSPTSLLIKWHLERLTVNVLNDPH